MDFLEGLTEGKGDMAGIWFKHLPARPTPPTSQKKKQGERLLQRE